MEKKQRQIQAWKFMMDMVMKVPDAMIRNAMLAEFKDRARREWGWCPTDNDYVPPTNAPNLNDWEQEFVDDIEKLNVWRFDPRKTKRAAELNEARCNMMEFIRNKGSLADIPPEIRSDTIDELYYDCLAQMGKDVGNNVYDALKTPATIDIDHGTDPFDGKTPTLETMTDWLRKGGFFLNLPARVRTPELSALYVQAIGELHNEQPRNVNA